MTSEDLRRAQDAIDREGDSGTPGGERKSQATRLVEIAVIGADLWRCDDEAWASVRVRGHAEHLPLKSRGFRDGYVVRSFYQQEGKAPGGQALTDAMNTLRGIALFDGEHHLVCTRIGGHDKAIYLDLANEAWEVVEITNTGWRIMTDCPVRFRHTKGMLAMPTPQRGGNIGELRGFVNVTDKDWPLLLGALISMFRDLGPYPVLVLQGEHGSAKSTTARVLRMLVDPNGAPLRALPKDPRDLMIAATNSWMVALDNLSHISPWLSDAMCRLSTGGGFSTRELYTDDGEAIFDAQRPVIVNGIEELATRADLLDRSIILYLPAISEEDRRQEVVFWSEFERARPYILGALLDAVVVALRDADKMVMAKLPRMADFATWAMAAEPALGLARGVFMGVYTGNRDEANALVLESSPVATLIQQIAKGKEWSGTATDLLNELTELASEKTRELKSWPKTPRTLSNVLRKLAPNLRAVGVDMNFAPSGGKRVISLGQVGIPSSPTSPASPSTPGLTGAVTQDHRNGDDEMTQDDAEVTMGKWAPRDECDANDADDARIPVLPKVEGMDYEEIF